MNWTRSSIGIVVVIALCGVVTMTLYPGDKGEPRSSSEGVSITPMYPSTNVFTLTEPQPRREAVFAPPIAGAIVNHHLLAANFIEDTLRKAWRPGIQRILLLAPNHFSAGRGSLISTTRGFRTPYGDVLVDVPVVRRLAAQSVISLDDEPFVLEHGLSNILPFLRQLYPEVPIVPLITKGNATAEKIDAVRDQLLPEVTGTTLVIASLDFAHGQTASGADALDQQSLQTLMTLNLATDELNHDGLIGVDSPATLRLFLGLMRQVNARHVAILHHSNSAYETGQMTATDVTSHITGLFSRFPIMVQ